MSGIIDTASRDATSVIHQGHEQKPPPEDSPERRSGEYVNVHNFEPVPWSRTRLSAAQIGRMAIAYEPVWAIGTGPVASAAEAQEICHAIRANCPRCRHRMWRGPYG